MYNFFVEDSNINDSTIILNGDDYNHIKNVLRMTTGEQIQICGKQSGRVWLTEISKIDKEIIACKIIEEKKSNESNVQITVYQGIPKSTKMEYIIQKSVELGAYKIVPVEMKYCVAKMKNEDKKISRWQAISEAAAKQSKRSIIPKIENSISVKELCVELAKYDCAILAYEDEQENSIKTILKNNKKIDNIAIIVGPEGGIAKEEAELLISNGAKSTTLGKRILRTETASSAILSMIMYEYEL